MAKRFIDTGFLNQKWIRKLAPDKKIFLIYLMLKCDNAGILELDLEDASFWIGAKITNTDFLPENYLIPISDSKYFMPKFIEWQYKDISSNKHIVSQARQILKKHGLIDINNTLNLDNIYINITKDLPKVQVTGIGNGNGIGKKGGMGGKTNEESKSISSDKQKEVFDSFRKQYPGTKRGLDVEFANFVKKHRDWREVVELLEKRLNYQKEARQVRKENKLFVPEWKNLQTWINQRCWEDIINTEE